MDREGISSDSGSEKIAELPGAATVLRLIVSRMGRQGIISLMKKTPSFKELLHLDHIINICLLLVAKPPKAVGGANNF